MDTRWKIGSDLTSKICLRDASILVDHAYVARQPERLSPSQPPQQLSRFTQWHPLRDSYLRHGDNLQIGRIKLEYRTDSDQAEPQQHRQAQL